MNISNNTASYGGGTSMITMWYARLTLLIVIILLGLFIEVSSNTALVYLNSYNNTAAAYGGGTPMIAIW